VCASIVCVCMRACVCVCPTCRLLDAASDAAVQLMNTQAVLNLFVAYTAHVRLCVREYVCVRACVCGRVV